LIRPTPACTATPSSTSTPGEYAAGHLLGAQQHSPRPLAHRRACPQDGLAGV